SYWLLSPELQAFFNKLAVFRGGWSLEAAEAVCDEPLALDHLEMLRECSLIVIESDDRVGAGQLRFRMLETLREYAAEKLSPEAAEDLRRRHAGYFLGFVEEAEPRLTGPEQAASLHRLEAEHDNLRAALAWCLNGKDEGGRM